MTPSRLIAAVTLAAVLAGCTGGNQSVGREPAAAPATGISISGEARIGVVK